MQATPQSAVFYSSVRGWGWGAPDYVWPRAAHILLDRGIPVLSIVHPSLLQHSEIIALQLRGATILPQPPQLLNYGRISKLRSWINQRISFKRSLKSHLNKLKNPHIFINQGGSYDVLFEDELRQALENKAVSYDLFFHSNNPVTPLPASVRADAVRLFTNANRCLFNSEWMRDLTEIQILKKLENSAFFNYRVRFPYETPLPWPVDDFLGTVKFAAISRFDTHHKGLDALLKGLSLLPVDLPPWSLDIYGHGPDGAYLQELIVWLGLQLRVTLHPFVENVQSVWATHHILVFPSRYEGLGVSMLEAMACGRPVLRTPYGGCSEWILHGQNGFICPASEPALIADSLSLALRSKEKLPAMGQNAFSRIQSQLPCDPWTVYLEPFRNS